MTIWTHKNKGEPGAPAEPENEHTLGWTVAVIASKVAELERNVVIEKSAHRHQGAELEGQHDSAQRTESTGVLLSLGNGAVEQATDQAHHRLT